MPTYTQEFTETIPAQTLTDSNEKIGQYPFIFSTRADSKEVIFSSRADAKPVIFHDRKPGIYYPIVPEQVLSSGATISGNFSTFSETIPAQTLSYNTSVA